jgi:hypothetical protein
VGTWGSQLLSGTPVAESVCLPGVWVLHTGTRLPSCGRWAAPGEGHSSVADSLLDFTMVVRYSLGSEGRRAMTFMRPGLIIALAVALLASSAGGATIVVDPAGGGNFDNIPEAMFRGSADDTVLVLPGSYQVEQSVPYPWPIHLTADSPTLVSQGGAALTLIFGDGLLSAFEIPDGRFGARVLISGFRFRLLESPFDWDSPAAGAEVCFTDNMVEECEIGVDIRWGDGLVARNTIEGPGYYGIRASYFDGTIEDNKISGFLDAGVMGTRSTATRTRPSRRMRETLTLRSTSTPP